MGEKRFAGVELGGTTWLLAIAVNNPQNIIDQTRIDTTTPEETLQLAISWLQSKQFEAIGVASFGPVDLNPASATYGFITSTPKPGWANTDIVGAFKQAFPDVPIGFETDVNAPALYEVVHGGHGANVSSACYITVGTGVGVGVCVDHKAVHGFMHPEGGHVFVPIAEADLKASFKGVCPFHGSCVEGMVASRAIADRKGIDRRELENIKDDDDIWDTIAHYLAYLCVNLTMTVSPQVIVIGGGISKRKLLFDRIRSKFESIVNEYVRYPPIESYIKPSFHDQIGLVSSLELARLQLQAYNQMFSEWDKVLFQHPTESMTSSLGIDYIRASAPTTTLVDGLVLQQNLKGLGIAGVVWNCARVLIQFLTHPHNVHILQHKRVIELGSGTGAVGLACAIHCAPLTSLLLTDLESVIVGITVPNIETVTKQHQQIEDMLSVDQLHAQSYPWGSDTKILTEHTFDIVLCSDCLYEPTLYDDFLSTLLALTSVSEHVLIYLAYKQRHPLRERAFFINAANYFHIQVCPTVNMDRTTISDLNTIFICCLQRKSTY